MAPSLAFAQAEGPLDVDPEDLRPGLVATYRSLDPGVREVVCRVDPKPAFTLGTSSPHPRLPSGPFEVVWGGVLQVQDPGPIRFSAFVGGELELEVDGQVVLKGSGTSDTSRFEAEAPNLKPGLSRLAVRFQSLAGVPARLQIFWEGPTFAREPLPAWKLSHLADAETPELALDLKAAAGREAVGRLGCVRCHRGAFPGVDDLPPGPSLADASRRLDRDWILRWLEAPSKVRSGARMPALFREGRAGYVERWIVADSLGHAPGGRKEGAAKGDHRAGRISFLSLGCVACHFVPEQDRAGQADMGRVAFDGLGDRMGEEGLATFLGNPLGRFPDGRMPRLPVAPDVARDIAAYLLLWSPPSSKASQEKAPTPDEIREVGRRLGVSGGGKASAVANALMAEVGCTSCHTGLGPTIPKDLPLHAEAKTGCLAGRGEASPKFHVDDATRDALTAYLGVASREVHPSPFASRQGTLARAGCVKCHQRDSDRPAPLEMAGRSLGAGYLETIPYQRVPRLTNPHRKLLDGYFVDTVREGVAGLRPANYTYKMPAFGPAADELVRAVAEADGELPAGAELPLRQADDPTLATLAGPELVGPQGYGCISCHVWDGKQLSQPDPGAIGPDLTRVVGRVRRDWFDRFVEDPGRAFPGTPMPTIFPRGQKATLANVLDGDAARQKEALWRYFSLGKKAPAPKAPPPLPIAGPSAGEGPLVAQIPIRLPDGTTVESLCLLTASHDLVVYDLASSRPIAAFVGGRILRHAQGRTRQYLADGTSAGLGLASGPAWQLAVAPSETQVAESRVFHGYDRLADGALLRYKARFKAGDVEVRETLRVLRGDAGGRLARELRLNGIPKGSSLVVRSKPSSPQGLTVEASTGAAESRTESDVVSVRLTPDPEGNAVATFRYELPAARASAPWEGKPREISDPEVGSLERPGYRAVAFPRPKLESGEDRIMPAALAVDPRLGTLFVSSLKTGELFAVEEPRGEAGSLRFKNYARGLFQDNFAMLAEADGLNVLHRRNLTRVTDSDGDGLADRFDRVEALPHGVADTYDYAYGLVRDRDGRFILSYAPYANTTMPGSGGVLRLVPGRGPEEVAFGLRNPLGWTTGPGGEVFYTDNQGEWVAANKLTHVVEGRFFGFPNPAQKQHASRPLAKPAVWIPYGWAHSVNGAVFDRTGGRFGPFDGQFFLAELMFGGAIVRANVDMIKGQYQGACFPFWGKGLLGPVSLAFDPKGHLYVGGITEPGWMAQPDRGAVFRIDFNGTTPFEIRSIHALPGGFRLVFTKPVEARVAGDPRSYRLERYRYEYTGSYGSPELDRTTVPVERAGLAPDRLSVELATVPLVRDRVYRIAAPEVRSADGEVLVHDTGVYTLNEIPDAPTSNSGTKTEVSPANTGVR